MSEIERFDINWSEEELVPYPDGEFTHFSAHEARIAELEGNVDYFKQAADHFRAERDERAMEREQCKRSLDQAEARFTAFLDALTGDAGERAAVYAWGTANTDAGVHYPVPGRMRIALQAARTAALEAVGETG